LHEAADLLEAGRAVELRHSRRHLVSALLADELAAGPDVIRLAAAGAEPGIGLKQSLTRQN
jgi:hypothetical protein